ncbi:MAG TPA: c-type cytochrome [Gammaproteobacteria bacterium]|nr:c-type cytochrome [Gammaproteobacteria bacterium]
MKNSKKFLLNLPTVFVLALAVAVPAVSQAEEKKADKEKGPLMDIGVSAYTKRPDENGKSVAEGRAIYESACIYCHGIEGMGDGPVATYLNKDLAPQPRDFTSGIYKFRSTASGELPMDEDLYRTVTRGVTGFMPGFVGLSPTDRWKVVYYIKSLSEDFKGAEPPEAINVVGSAIPSTAVSVNKGYKVYQEYKCWECHGGGGLGDGKKAPDLKDDWDYPLPPRNLTQLRSYKNGSEPIDLYRTIMAGLDGGAMPSYADFFEGEEDDVWHLVNYIRALSQ